MLPPSLLLLPLCFPLPALARDETGSVEDEQELCVTELLRGSSGALGKAEVVRFCEAQAHWITGGTPHGEALKLHQGSPSGTAEQQRILRQIRSCKGAECLEGLLADSAELRTKRSANLTASFQVSRFRSWERSNSVSSPSLGRVERKEYRVLTDAERERFHRAMRSVKSSGIYALLIRNHTAGMAPGAHFGPGFLPFHRELGKQLELALRREDPAVALPYWDSTLDEKLPSPEDSVMFSEAFAGEAEGTVLRGPFAHWAVGRSWNGRWELSRSARASPSARLYSEPRLRNMMRNKRRFAQLTQCVDPTFEGMHGGPHQFVGGFMTDIEVSPSDPMFFLHHSFVDLIWEEWRQARQSRGQRESDYPDVYDRRDCSPRMLSNPADHHADALMRPFNLRIRDGLANHYTDSLYSFQGRPTCANGCQGSAHLFCSRGLGQCVSKVRRGGDCRGLEGEDVCEQGRCRKGRCEATPRWAPRRSTLPNVFVLAPTTQAPRRWTRARWLPSWQRRRSWRISLRAPAPWTTTSTTTTTTTRAPPAWTRAAARWSWQRSEGCSSGRDCEDWEYCGESSGSCRRQRPRGQPCDPLWSRGGREVCYLATCERGVCSDGQSKAGCDRGAQCGRGNFCSAVSRQCRPQIRPWVSCSNDWTIDSRGVCSGGHVCGSDQRCRRATSSFRRQPFGRRARSRDAPPSPSSRSFPLTYIAVTVLTGSSVRTARPPRREVTVESSGTSPAIPSSYTRSSVWRRRRRAEWREGLVAVGLRDPDQLAHGLFPLVDAEIRVEDHHAKPCRRLCRLGTTGRHYGTCGTNIIRISSSSTHSLPIAYRRFVAIEGCDG